MCPCRFIGGNKCTTVVWDVYSEGDWRAVVLEGHSLYFAFNFAVNLKLSVTNFFKLYF